MEPKPPTPRRPGERAEPPPSRPEREREREAPYPTRVYPPAAGVNAFEADESPPGTSRKRGRVAGIAGLVVLALLVVAGLAAFAYDRSRDGDEQRDTAGAAATATRQAELARNATADAILAGVATPAPTQPPATQLASPTAATVSVAPTSALTLPTIGVTPTRAAARPTATRTPASAAGPVSIDELLPTADEVPEGLEQLPDGERSAEEVAEVFSDPDDAAQRLDDWGWRRNVIRTFEAPEGSLPPDQTSFVEISIHQFANPASARAALDYFADELVVVGSLTEEEGGDPLGDEMRLLTRVEQSDNVVTVYIREGSVLIKVSGFAAAGDPTSDVLAVAETVLEK